ncbi:MAG: radical SAM protein [Candidatus Methanomethylicia archaeon]
MKKNWRITPVKFALCYPNAYRVGMSCLATHLLYEILNMRNDVLCERFFYDSKLPILSIESKKPLNLFNIIGFSMQYELDYIHSIKMLLKSGIPPLSDDRKEGDPIVCFGGPSVTSNPEPLAPFADVIFIGEVEDTLNQFIDTFLERRSRKRFEILDGFSKIPGVYVPKLNNRVKRVWVNNLDKVPHAIRQIIPKVSSKSSFHPVLGKSFLLEVSRGCGWGCRFCLEGYNYLPMRFRSFEKLIKILDDGLKYTPTNNIVIIGSAALSHPNLKELLNYLHMHGYFFSMPSLRLDLVDEDLLMLLKKGGQRTPVFAPETSSERLLNIINKRFELDRLFDTIRIVKNVGFKNVKLYFILGLPGETIDDVQSILDIVCKVADLGFMGLRSVRLSFSFFVPKANTPFQWFGMENKKSLKDKINLIRMKLKGDKRFEVRFPSIRESMIQAFISRSGREISPILLYVAKIDGNLSSWYVAEKHFKFSIEEIVTKTLDSSVRLPWEFFDIGYDRLILFKEFNKAISEL